MDASAGISDRLSAMSPALGYLPETILLFIFLCIFRLRQRRKRSTNTELQSCITDTCRVNSWGKTPMDMHRREGELIAGNSCISGSSFPPSTVYDDGVSLLKDTGSNVTSGQLAYMVQQRDRQKDTERNSTYMAPYQDISPRSCPLTLPWSRHEDNNGSIIETDIIEIFQDSDLHDIWRRRVLEIVGQ